MSLLSFCIFISSKDSFFVVMALLVVALLGQGIQKDKSDIRNRRFYLILCLQKIKKLLFLMCLLSFCIFISSKDNFFVVMALLVVALLGKGIQKDRSDIRNRRFYLILCLQKIKNFCYLCVFCPFVSLSPQKA